MQRAQPSRERIQAAFCGGGIPCNRTFRGLASAVSPDSAPPPPSLSRWSEGFCTRGETRSALRPHRACLGGAGAWGQEKDGRRTAPLVQKPALHRGEPGGGGTRRPLLAGAEALAPPGRARWGRDAGSSRCWCRSPCSTGASPVGAEQGFRQRAWPSPKPSASSGRNAGKRPRCWRSPPPARVEETKKASRKITRASWRIASLAARGDRGRRGTQDRFGKPFLAVQKKAVTFCAEWED